MLGANPLASNGSLLTAPDMRGRLRAHPGARRPGRRDRPAPQPHGRGRRRASLHPARAPTRTSCSRSFTRALRRGPRATWAARGALSTGSRRCEELAARLHARGRRRRRAGSTPDEIRRIARELAARRARRRLRAHRHLHAGVRHARELARRRAERPDRQPRPPGRRDVHAAGRRRAQHARHARARARACSSAAGRAACAACREVFGELPVACLAEEIDTPGEGQVRALFTFAGQPGARARRTPAACGARSSRST